MKNWENLEKGDKLYILYPKISDRGIEYEYQESYVITNKYHYSPVIRFKITNSNNLRQRLQISIPNSNIESKYIWINPDSKRVNLGSIWGNIIVCFENPDKYLPEAYKLMIKLKEMEINTLITCYKDFLVELDLMKNKKILKNE